METNEKTTLATKLVSLRKQKGLTQMELAEKLNVSRQAISRWEVGAAVPSTDNLKVLGDLYDVPVDYLLNDEIENIGKENEESQEITSAKQKEKGVILNHRIVYISVIVILGLLAGISFAVTKFSLKQSANLPIEKMTVVAEDDYINYTFSIE